MIRRWRAAPMTVLVAVGLLAVSVFLTGSAGAAGRVVAEPDPTVTPTVPGTPAPTAAPTQPPQTADPTTPPTAPETTAPPVSVWDQDGSSGGSSGQWQPPSQSIAAQDPVVDVEDVTETTEPPMTTTEDLLVGPSTTRATPTTPPPRDLSGPGVTRTGGSSDPKIWAVVAALSAVALGLGVATVLYWRRTRPSAGRGDVGDGGVGDGDGERRARRGRNGSRRRSRYADLVVTSPDPQ